MKCDFCDKKATVFLTQLVEGNMKKVCLCEACAKERGVTDPTGFSLADMVLGGAPAFPIPGIGGVFAASAGGSAKTCPTCGFGLDDLLRVRRFGCADCYATFRGETLAMLRGMHRGLQHAGKTPKGLVAREANRRRISDLQEKLQSAIESESYEEAADLRDQIRNLESA
ncbi:MAG: UvrB/UvrC motif-containing protein [Luteolibacter sp.]|jgi:protein arginine kinase activator